MHERAFYSMIVAFLTAKPNFFWGLISLVLLLVVTALVVSLETVLSAVLVVCVGLFVAIALFSLSLGTATLGYFVFVTLLVGTLQYYSDLGVIAYTGFLALAAMLMIFGFVDRRPMFASNMLTGFAVLMPVYGLIISVSADHSWQHSILAMIVYFAPFALCCFLPSFFLTKEGLMTLKRLMLGLALLPLVQVWFALHQRLILGRGTTSWDSVTGTFGGSILGTGPNTVLMVFLIVSTVVALFLARRRVLTVGALIAILVATAVTTALGETKAMFVLLPMALLVQNLRLVWRRPIAVAMGSLVLVAGIIAMQSWYETFNYGARYGEQAKMTFTDRAAQVFEQQVANDAPDNLFDRRSRLATVEFWDQATGNDKVARIFGRGLGASRTGFTGDGAAASVYSAEALNTTVAAQLLWDGGIVLLFLLLLLFVVALVKLQFAYFAAKTDSAKDLVVTIQAALFVFVGSIFYKNVLLEHLAMQSLAALILSFAFLPITFFEQIIESFEDGANKKC